MKSIYKKQQIQNFLVYTLINDKNWRNHIEHTIRKLSGACNAVRYMVHISNIKSQIDLQCTLSFCYKYGIIFCGNSSYSGKIFTVRKKMVRITADAQPRTSCRSLFQQLEFLPVPCQLILSLMNFTINNYEIFQTNSSINHINTRKKASSS